MSEEKTTDQTPEQEDVAQNTAEEGQNPSPADGVDVADGNGSENEDQALSEQDRLRKEAADMKDAWTRERAEFMNYKKRAAQEQGRARVFAVTNFVKELLPAIDNLDRVVQSDSDNEAVKNFITGVEMIQAEFLSILGKERIQKFSPAGQPFDPHFMEAISMEESNEIDTDMVLEVFQDGYVYEPEEGEKQVIRPARVKVAKPGNK